MIAAVTDTHALLFHALGSRKLGRKAAAVFAKAERQEALVYVPAVVLWEVGVLARLGKIVLKRSLRSFAGDLFSNPSYQPVEILPDHVYLSLEEAPREDPFDGLICAVARHLELPLMTRDGAIAESKLVEVLW